MLPSRADRLSTFLLVAFGWSWAWDAVYYWFGWWGTLPTTFPRQWGVPLGAVAVVWASDVSVRSWLGRVGRWRVQPGLYLLALAIPLAITNVQQVLRALGGGSVAYAPPAGLPAVVAFVLANALLLGGVEEFGWRGVVQPRLQERTSVLTAGLAVGVLWWAWHLPLFLGHPNFPLEATFVLEYTAFVLGASVVFGAFVNATGGSVLPVMVMHATTNLGPVLDGSGGPLADAALVPLVVGSGAWWLVAAVLVAAFGRSMVPDPLAAAE
jgi:membrane protease YdiL (CAAX protease family)